MRLALASEGIVRSSDFFAALDLLPEPALVSDGHGLIAFANRPAALLLHAEPRSLTGQRLARFIQGADAASASSPALEQPSTVRVGDERRPADLSTREVVLDDGLRLRLVLLHPLRAGPGSAALDSSPVADRADLAQALRQNEERLRHATQAAEVGVFDIVVSSFPPPPPFWSETLRAMLGFDAQAEADFFWFRQRVHPEDGPSLDAAIEHSRDPLGDGRIEIEYRWHHPTRGCRWFINRSVTYFVEQDGQRVAHHAIGAIIDITERREAKEALQLRAAILDATPDLVAISRLDGTLVYLNRAARAFVGAPEGEAAVEGRLKRAHPAGLRELLDRRAIPKAKRHGAWSGESELIRHDGVAVPMSLVVLAQHDASGQVAYVCTIARDLSRERGLEEQFRQAQKMEAIGRLAGGVAHDFNNLLSVILGYAELAHQELAGVGAGELSPEGASLVFQKAQRALNEIVRAGERAAALTGQLLAFGRRQILKPRILDVNDVLEEFEPMVRRLIDERIALHVTHAPEPANIRADPNQVLQVLLNLVVNARDAMPQGGVLRVEAFRALVEESHVAGKLDMRPGVYTVLAVSDTGHGMDAATRDRIFEPFFTTKGPGEGTGLGLATVFGIVQQSGGSIYVYSEPGRGSTFKIYLPCTDELAEPPPPQPPPIEAPQHGVILVSEDDEQVRTMVSTILMRAGYEVLIAAHPSEAIELARAYPDRIDLLITDVVMPGMTGTVLAQALHQTRPDLPVLFTSGYTEDTIVHQGVLDEGVDFLAKPITPGRLLNTISEVLRQHRRP